MAAERRVKLFRNGRNRAIRIPREFEFEDDEAIIRKEGNRLIVEPIPKRGLLEVLATLKQAKDEFPDIDGGLGELDDVNLRPDA
ncbi:MAG: AbrB/MazE/SpoVT family DNA-binding domain-containing protein [Gammaproteobacteria bacterium]|nr:AbrB/MazE/SpoVT family DNA-binding domain-containing protein [Gammaproteobacteria bacterium]